jgi:hypothetical protein
MKKNRIRIPGGIDQQGRYRPGEWVEDESNIGDVDYGPLLGLVLTLGAFALVVVGVLQWIK